VFDRDPGSPALKRGGPAEPPKFAAHVYCGQTAGSIKMPLGEVGVEVGLSPGDFVIDGDKARLPKKGWSLPIFGPRLLWPKGSMHQDATWYGGIGSDYATLC